MAPARVIERLYTRCHVEGECIVSDYSTGSHGYAQVGWSERGHMTMALAHRLAWEATVGPIPANLTIDHVCRNRRCINVDHRRLLTNMANATDNGMARRTVCPKGHAYSATNTLVDGRGHRRCRACAHVRYLERKAG